MRVIIKHEGHRWYIPIPMWLGGVGIKYGMKYATKESLSKEQINEIVEMYKVFRKSIKEYKGLKIVEVEGSEGESVTIII